MTDEPISCELSGATLRRIAELMPAVSGWAASQGEPDTGPADIVELAVALLHQQVFTKARDMIANGEVEPRGPLH